MDKREKEKESVCAGNGRTHIDQEGIDSPLTHSLSLSFTLSLFLHKHVYMHLFNPLLACVYSTHARRRLTHRGKVQPLGKGPLEQDTYISLVAILEFKFDASCVLFELCHTYE